MSDTHGMELREFEAFLTLAETLHFGRAADRLGLSQSRVSQLVGALERRVGASLFERTSRRVTLTPLGEQFLSQAAPAYTDLKAALDDARALGRQVEGLLRVGFLPSLAGEPLTEIADAFREKYPQCKLVLTQVTMTDLREAWDGMVDIQATLLPVDEPGITVGPSLGSYARVLAVAVDHPLASKTATVEDLADYVLPVMPDTIPAGLHEAYWPTRTPSGRPIPRRKTADLRDALHLVARGELVIPTDSGTIRFRRYPGVTAIPITDLPPAQAVLTWRTAHENARIRAFAGLARQEG